jgi:hypothetical protein
VVDPEAPRAGQAAPRAFFGATVRYANAAGVSRVVSIVGSTRSISTATTSVTLAILSGLQLDPRFPTTVQHFRRKSTRGPMNFKVHCSVSNPQTG